MTAICFVVERMDRTTAAPDQYRYQFERNEIFFGRSDSVDVQLPDASISLVHARLRLQDGQLLLEDLGSTNGTSVEQTKLTPHKPLPVRAGMRLRIGPYEITLTIPRPNVSATMAEDTMHFARRMALEALGLLGDTSSDPKLTVIAGPDQGASVVLPRHNANIVLGRADDCTLPLRDVDSSRHHCQLSAEDDEIIIRDRDSKNGTIVNGARIQCARILRDGDCIRIGQTLLEYTDPAQAYLATIKLEDHKTGVTSVEKPRLAPAASSIAAQRNNALPSPSQHQTDRVWIASFIGLVCIAGAAILYLMQ